MIIEYGGVFLKNALKAPKSGLHFSEGEGGEGGEGREGAGGGGKGESGGSRGKGVVKGQNCP